MIVVFAKDVTAEQIDRVVAKVEAHGLRAHLSRGTTRTILGCIGDERRLTDVGLKAMAGVEEVIPILRPYKLAARELVEDGSVIRIGRAEFGGPEFVVVAGPCSVEGRALLLEVAEHVGRRGARALRGGAFKPRTSPYAFRGLGREALEMLAEARERTGLAVVTEVMEPRQVGLVADYADMLQIGARNMQNFDLLEEVGRSGHPVLLKRGMSARIQELLLAAEYILNQGNMRVVLCERGIRTFENATRNTLDISAIQVLKRETHLPVIVDPSHAAGRRDIIPDLAAAAVAAGADGLMVEVHPRPDEALSDGDQALGFGDFDSVMERVAAVARAMGHRGAKAETLADSAPAG
jgi:3-deoxy-7-phosphoheptulonate synthase